MQGTLEHFPDGVVVVLEADSSASLRNDNKEDEADYTPLMETALAGDAQALQTQMPFGNDNEKDSALHTRG